MVNMKSNKQPPMKQGNCNRTAVIEVNDIVLDLKSMLEADTLSELKQCVYDLLDELEGDD